MIFILVDFVYIKKVWELNTAYKKLPAYSVYSDRLPPKMEFSKFL